MTPEEKQEIVQAVIAALKTNGRTIMQLTEATQLTDNDYFEIHGGRRIAYSYLYSNVMSETESIIEDFETDVNTLMWVDYERRVQPFGEHNLHLVLQL